MSTRRECGGRCVCAPRTARRVARGPTTNYGRTSTKTWGQRRSTRCAPDLLELYTGGAEELWSDSHAAAYVADAERPCSGVHRMRYLNYRCAAGRTPTLLYGAGFAEEYGLPTGAGWLGFDLSSVGLPAGAAYYVVDVEAAFEGDAIYGEAKRSVSADINRPERYRHRRGVARLAAAVAARCRGRSPNDGNTVTGNHHTHRMLPTHAALQTSAPPITTIGDVERAHQ